MNPETPHIILNGLLVTPEVAKERLLSPSCADWEKELHVFLNEWFSDSEYVQAQTSGSTGEPKPIELSKSFMITSAKRTIQYFGLQAGNRLLLSLPCRYIAGKMMVVRAIVGRMNLVAIDPTSDFDFLKDETFDFGAMVSNQIYKLLEQPLGRGKVQNIRNLLVGGSAISSELEKRISQLSSRIVSTYGMTETASHIAIRELSGRYEANYYQCLPGISVGLTANGCLEIHVPEFADPLQTNDLAELLSSTSFRILGRADSVIISGGVKYSPESIEKKLEGLIDQRFIISSVPDEKLGEKLVLVIEGKSFPTESLLQKVRNLLPTFEQPKHIWFLKLFPETASGKIKRAEIRNSL